MRTCRIERRRGQVLIMTTLALFVLCGMLGLVVDLGWSYFTRKSAQAAADVAALSAAKAAYTWAKGATAVACGADGVTCAPEPVNCPASGNLQSACLYAAQQGFANSGRQTVTVQASDRFTAPTVDGCTPRAHHPPTAGCVDTYYWVTVRITQRIPQLFSAILGNTEGTVSARATAAVAQAVMGGQLRLLNRENDGWFGGAGTPGNNIDDNGGPDVRVPGGILLASAAHGTGSAAAGFLGGNSVIEAPFTKIRTGGTASLQGKAQWVASPTNADEGPEFQDPFSDRGMQPPVLNGSRVLHPVPGGILNSDVCPGGVCTPGIYYSFGVDPGCQNACGNTATGYPLVVQGDLSFQGGAFGQFIIFGGLHTGQSTVNFGPGEYILAGTRSPDVLNLQMSNKTLIQGGDGNDAGRIFILTDSKYPGLENVTSLLDRMSWPGPDHSLTFAASSVKGGNNEDTSTTLWGLNRRSPNLPDALQPFTPVVIWQDQRNSYVKYSADGTVSQCPDLAHPCLNTDYPGITSTSPQFDLMATPFTALNGAIYQPRGAWSVVQASGTMQGAMQIVSGAIRFRGTGDITMLGVTDPTVVYVVALVE